MTNVLVALAVIFIGFCIWGDALLRVFSGAKSSDIAIEGRSLSNSEARDGMREIAEMARGGEVGNPSSIDVSGEPTTELGKRFKTLIGRSQTIQATYERETAGRQVTDLLTDERLSTAKGRARSRGELAQWRKITKTFCDEGRVVQNECATMFSGSSGTVVARFSENMQALAEMDAAMTRVYDVVGELLDVVDKTKPDLEGGRIVFRTSAEAKAYNALTERFNLESAKVQKIAERIDRGKQERFDRSVERMSG